MSICTRNALRINCKKPLRCKGTTFFAYTQENERESEKYLHFASKIGRNRHCMLTK